MSPVLVQSVPMRQRLLGPSPCLQSAQCCGPVNMHVNEGLSPPAPVCLLFHTVCRCDDLDGVPGGTAAAQAD
jgi:hypothetical protein